MAKTTKTRRGAWRARAALLLLFAAAPACAQDALSGRYLPADGPAIAGGELDVVADGDGWQARFGGEPRRLDPLDGDELRQLFPGLADEAGVQCAASARLLLCAVPPGTRIAGGDGQDVVAADGYFATVIDAGMFLLKKVP